MGGYWNAVSVISTVVLTTAGWFLGWKMGKRQRRVSLLGERLPLYEATRKFLSKVLEANRVEREWLMNLQRETRNREFLFGEEVGRHIDKLYEKGLFWVLLNDTHRTHEAAQLTEWFVTQIEETKKVFGKYLKVTEQ